MNERIKIIRETLDLSMRAFAEKINVSNVTISRIENNQRNLTDRTISDVCREFYVNETWLRTGNGEMFIDEKEIFSKDIANRMGIDRDDLPIILAYLKLNKESRKVILELAEKMVDLQKKDISFMDLVLNNDKDEIK